MKIIKILFIAFFTIILTACGKNTKDEYKTIQEKLMAMESYYAKATITYISNKSESTYTIEQKVLKDGRYLIKVLEPEEVLGSIILFDGNIVWSYNPNLDSKISVIEKDSLERTEISLFSFLEHYVKSQDTAVETSKMDNNIYTILDAEIPGQNDFFSTEKLWINNETKEPEKLVIYDNDEKERIILTITDFEYNAKLDEDLFNIKNISNEK